MNDRYPFMREFTGVPLYLSPEARDRAAQGLMGIAMYLTVEYAPHVERIPSDIGGYTDLYLHDPRPDTSELLQVTTTFNRQGEAVDARMGLTVLEGDRATSAHNYTLSALKGVTRRDTLDMDVTRQMGPTVEEQNSFDAILRAVLDEDSERAPREEGVNMSAFEALTEDAVDIIEVRGLLAHIQQRVGSGLYIPVPPEEGLRLQGLIRP